MKKTLYQSFILLVIITIIHSCAPTKNTASRRFFNNLVSKYNIYFNGKEAMRVGVEQLNNNHKDDYSNILKIFPYGTEQNADAIKPMMNRAYEKGSKVILKHSMLFRNVEYNNWVDDSYILIGKSFFYKQEYIVANESFEFVSRNFPKSQSRFEAQLWLAKSHTFAGRYQRADVVLTSLEPFVDRGETSKEVKRKFPLVKADYLIRTGQYSLAAEYLEKALKEKQKRKTKIRISFIAGQLYQKIGNNQKAIFHYLNTLKLTPPYEIAFHSRLFAAECYDTSDGKNESILSELNKMIKDAKNKDYLDRIYYALANIELKKNNQAKAIEYLKLSAISSVDNNIQKGLTYKKLSELHFDMKKYQETKIYLDSTIAFLPKDYETYKEIEQKSKILTDLVENLYTIQLNDSLIKLSLMSENERNSVIDKIITEIIKKEQEEKELERQREIALLNQRNPNPQTPAIGQSNVWYYYNSAAVNFGKTEFVKIWGTRKLEDLWRLRDKELQSFDFNEIANEDLEDEETVGQSRAEQNPKDRAFYIKDIPNTPEKVEKAKEKILKSHYKAAVIYKDELKDFPPSVELFEALLKRFPDSEFELQTFYNLYLIFNQTQDNTKKQYYAQLLLTEYPESSFAKIINDPDYFANITKQADEVNLFYSQTYEAYQNNDCNTVTKNSNIAIDKYSSTEVIAKFEYLKALCIARTKNKAEYLAQLTHIVTNYPNTEVAALAQTNLDFLVEKEKDPQIEEKEGKTNDIGAEPSELYKVSPESFHLFILLVDLKTANLSSIREVVTDFNNEFFPTANLNLNSLFLTSTRQMLTITRFNNQEEALKYLRLIQNNTKVRSSVDPTNPTFLIITAENYPVFFKEKNEQQYLDFFKKNYEKK